ncbi:YueH family protein [Bacillus sp. B1-b2]|uniref:YueH family protein n=1 Tax=Bacillus sp. B1-b2 TaxID=2653201 RepID=UPI00186A2170|nr:YueH family protein [Bacillus sp. B1-b2]
MMNTFIEEVLESGHKIFILQTPYQSVVISIPKLNWSTEISLSLCEESKYDHILSSLIFQMYEGNCTQLTQQILPLIHTNNTLKQFTYN